MSCVQQGQTYVKQESGGEEGRPLAIRHLRVEHGVRSADFEEGVLAHASGLLEVVVGGKGAVDVAQNHLLALTLLKTEF